MPIGYRHAFKHLDNSAKDFAFFDLSKCVDWLRPVYLAFYKNLARGESLLVAIPISSLGSKANTKIRGGVRVLISKQCRVLDKIADEDPVFRTGVESVFSFLVIGAWSAFESLASDLWETALNEGPKVFVENVLFEKPRLKPDSDSVRIDQEKSVPISKLKNYDYDLSKKMGSFFLREKKVDFQRLKNIEAAYKIAFGVEATTLFEAAVHSEIRLVSAVRNLLVHNGGYVDAEFQRNARGFAEFEDLKIGDIFPLDGALAIRLVNTSSKLGLALFQYVERQVSN